MRFFINFLIGTAITLAAGTAPASEATQTATYAPACIKLHDQYDALQTLSFPTTNITVLTIADRKGSEQVDGWIAVLKARYARRIDLRGLAEVGGVPWFLQGKIRKRFQEVRRYPVMMDWSGQVCAQLGYKRGVANVLLIDRDGVIRARFQGDATETAVLAASKALELVLAPGKSTESRN